MTAETGTPRAQHTNERRLYALVLIFTVSTVVFAASALEAANEAPPPWEIDMFTTVNQLPGWLYVVIWPFMQYGVFVTIPIATIVAWRFRQHRLAIMLGVSGVSIYLSAKVVKRIVDRGRPDAFLEDVIEREHFAQGSIGYTSGHAAVAATIATLTVVHLARPWREITVALVVIVMFGRMYVGAHLPLDLIGGVAMGIAAGCGAMLISRAIDTRRNRHRSEELHGKR